MNLVNQNHNDYPKKLSGLHQPPSHLYIESHKNNWQLLQNRPMVAVVGSRKQTAYGQSVTNKLVSQLAAQGVVIISGLALGIDATAHKACLDAGGQTIAVLPSGFDNIYPSSHVGLARQIINRGGALVSEYQPSSKVAFKSNFIARNRIVAGLGDALLVPEAAINSGSLHTVNFALELGRDVFAVPGPITSSTSEGCNNLIKTGAHPVTCVDDILQVLSITAPNAHQSNKPMAASPEEQIIIDILYDGDTTHDELISASQLLPTVLSQTLSFLEISGKVKSLPGNLWTLA